MNQHLFKQFFLLLLSAFLYFKGICQIEIPASLQQRLQGKEKFNDIKLEVEGYYKNEASRIRTDSIKTKMLNRQRKFWNRWLYWAESHLDEQGEVVTNNTERAYAAARKLINTNAQNARSAYGDWSFRGPHYVPEGVGRVNRLAFHPTNANIVYAGTSAGGLWRLTWASNTYTWTCLTNHIPELSISGIVISHADANDIYILTGDGDTWRSGSLVTTWGYQGSSIGVLKSTDAGSTWSQTGGFPGASGTVLGFTLVQDPNNANTLLAATNQGIFRTTNAGSTWTMPSFFDFNDAFVSNSNMAFDIEYKPGSSTTVYAAYNRSTNSNNASVSIFKSIDGGFSFKEKRVFNGVNRMGIAVTPANSNFVYLVCGPGNLLSGNPSNNTFKGLFFSSNSGDSFVEQTTAPDILGAITPIGGLAFIAGWVILLLGILRK